MLGVALSAYEHWLADESVALPRALGDAFDAVAHGLDGLDAAEPSTVVEISWPSRRSSAAPRRR